VARGEVSIGVPGALGPGALAALAPQVERAGFAGLWVNDTPDGDALAGLASAASATRHLRLGAGVLPLDRRPADEILGAIAATGVPEDRLTLGIGSGSTRAGALARVREAVAELAAGTSAAVVVGALGPRMRELAAETADGVLLNWVTARDAAEQAAAIRTGRVPAARVIAYVRTIVDPAARTALEAEAERYGAIPAYSANFDRLGVRPIDATLQPESGDLGPGIAAYLDAVDELVLRAVTATGSVEELARFVELASPYARRLR
jgi:alkanesulfonate monooxygenase SsuD/methylene tetrahydromethanopterin reductase-like flavin-dependent oxidoreductase (luciferase family)